MKFTLFAFSLLLSGMAIAGQVEDAFKANDKLFNALLGADQSQVEKAAQELAGLIEKDKTPELKGLKEGLKSLKAISKSNSKDKNIELYQNVAPSFVSLRRTGKVENYEIYYCPMIKKHWVQNQKNTPAVRNVFAQYMLECGELSK